MRGDLPWKHLPLFFLLLLLHAFVGRYKKGTCKYRSRSITNLTIRLIPFTTHSIVMDFFFSSPRAGVFPGRSLGYDGGDPRGQDRQDFELAPGSGQRENCPTHLQEASDPEGNFKLDRSGTRFFIFRMQEKNNFVPSFHCTYSVFPFSLSGVPLDRGVRVISWLCTASSAPSETS